MSTNSDDLKELSIAELFNPDERYIIPIYQRNYAWGATEIEQLIQDIYDAAKQNEASVSANKGNIDYYIGSLVVYLRENGSYETIDGQQRHTTLSILLALLNNTKLDDKPLPALSKKIAINLHFDSRPKSARTLNDLYKDETSVEPEEPVMLSAYNIATRYIKKEKIDLTVLSEYLLNQVKILRVKVPKDTDLNHYFEIMNNRGEQLEKHEVLKARMMAEYKNDVVAQTSFSAIWDACADMHKYVQLGFEAKIRDDVFGSEWSTCPSSFKSVKSFFVEVNSDPEGMLLSEIINKRQFSASSDVNHEETEKDERFSSVIDFPNFLLQVLRVNNSAEVPLDDKRLLDIFANKDNKLNIDPTTFIMQLLKCRMLFDKYIIKRDFDEKWSLLSVGPYTNKNKKSFSYINSVGKDEDENINNQLIMILSMFHVSYPTMVYKHWLSGALKALIGLTTSNEVNVAGDEYLTSLEQLSDDFFYNLYGNDEPESYHSLIFGGDISRSDTEVNESLLHTGTSVHNFVFNRLDYLLWQQLRSNADFTESDNQLDIPYIKERYAVFQFSFRTSVEHYFPQTNPWGEAPMDNVDRFGNLCLITPSSNSKLSNYSPTDKKQYYADKGRTESLKQAFMMSYSSWSPDGQGLDNIKNHEEMMIKVLCKNDI
jgi:hypothetical protein